MTSVSVSVLILGKKGRDLEREIEILGKIKGGMLSALLKFGEIELLKVYQMSSKCLMS